MFLLWIQHVPTSDKILNEIKPNPTSANIIKRITFKCGQRVGYIYLFVVYFRRFIIHWLQYYIKRFIFA